MKRLSTLIKDANVIESIGKSDALVSSVTFSLNEVGSLSLFIAFEEGHEDIDEAISAGSTAIVCEELPMKLSEGVTYVQVKSTRYAAGTIAANFYDHPSTKLQLVAVTGTNGKTSTVNFLHQLFRNLGVKAGLFSTIGNKVNDKSFPATLTTPDGIELNHFLAKMVEEECRYCFMEASSHGLHQFRLAGLRVAGAVFTNLSLDHLDYHKTYEAYRRAKKCLFDMLDENAFAVANYDDKEADYMLQDTKATKIFVSFNSPSDFNGTIIKSSFSHLDLRIDNHEMSFAVGGGFNAYNLLTTYAVANCLNCGADEKELVKALQSVSLVDGRFQLVEAKDFKVIVDFAHTPEALQMVLTSINEMRSKESRVIVVFGCGGDRDKSKRPLMAKIGKELSDIVIYTSDNPRNECPETILDDMMAVLDDRQRERVFRIVNRKLAIKEALSMAKQGDIVLIAGRGHESFQLVRGRQEKFKDIEVVREILHGMNHL